MEQGLVWNLQDLFKTDEEFYSEIEKVNSDIEEIVKFRNVAFDCDTLLNVLNLKWSIKEKTNSILIFGSLNYYKDVESSDTKKMKEIAEQLISKVDSSLSFIDKKIIELGEDTIHIYLSSNEKLKIYELHLSNIFRLRSHIQNDEINEQIKQFKNDINTTLTNYNSINREMTFGMISVDDVKIELLPSNIAKYLSSRDRETRKQTYLSVNSAYKEKSNLFADILNNLYSKRVKIVNLEHYFSVSEKALFDENINPIILDILVKSVHNNINLIAKYLELKTTALSINDPHLYDYGVPFDNGNRKKYLLDEAISIIKNALAPLGAKYLRVVDLLLSSNHIDAILDEKKHQSITFSWGTYSFMNYREAYIDLKNMIHELGHLVNAYLSKEKQPFIYEDSTVFVGETASLVNEILLNRYMYQIAESEEEKLFYLSTNIENYFTQIYRQTMYTEYENILYQYKKNEVELSTNLLENEYQKLLKKYYGEKTIYDECSDAEWARLGHLYRWSYYVYKYATGLIIASSVVESIIDQKSLSVDQYLEFLSSGSNAYSLDLLSSLGIDLTDETIINKSFSILEKDINEFEKILTKNVI